MSNSGTGYLLGSFMFSSTSGSGHHPSLWPRASRLNIGDCSRNIMNNAGLGYLRGRGLYDSFKHGAIKPSAFVPIMSWVDWHKYFPLYMAL